MQLKKIKRSILPLVLTACTVLFIVPAQAADVTCRSAKEVYQKATAYVLSGKISGSRSKRFVYTLDKKKGEKANDRIIKHAEDADDGLHTWGDYVWMELEFFDKNMSSPYEFYSVISYPDSYWAITVSQDTAYKAKKERAFLKSVKKKAKAITKNKKGNATKTRAIYNWIIKHVSYDYHYKKMYAYEAYYNKKAVCQGYANLMYVMCRDVGIPCRLAYNAKMNHEWVLVKINKKWYQCDPTWGDTTKKPNTYFLRGASMKGHRKPTSVTSCKLPKISKKAYYH